MIKKMIRYLIALVAQVIPRDKNLWITGKTTEWEFSNNPPVFFDNSKYFYLYLCKKTNEKVYWISNSKQEIELLRKLGLPVINYNSIRGKIMPLRAGYCFHHYGVGQVDNIFQYGSTQINFWHGTPLKKIGYDAVGLPPKPNILARILDRNGKKYIGSTSKYLSDNILKKAFNVSSDQMIEFGYPRTDILNMSKEEIVCFCKKYDEELLPYINKSMGKKVFLYMPTYRDDDIDYFKKANIDFERLNNALRKNNSVLFLKLHPLTRDIDMDGYDNVFRISNDADIYPFLVFVDFLITDYSSIFFDFLHLDREILFIPYDLEKYTSSRELYYDYKNFVPGKQYNSFDEFIDDIARVDLIDFSEKRSALKKLFIEDYNFDACDRTYKFIKGRR